MNWVMKIAIKPSSGSIQNAVLAARPQAYSPGEPTTCARTGSSVTEKRDAPYRNPKAALERLTPPARAAEVLLESAPSAVAAAWRQGFEEQEDARIVRAALEHAIAASGTVCTTDHEQAASMPAVLGEPDRMLACLDEALRQKRAPVDVKSQPAYDPYRGDPRPSLSSSA
jgi:hypothetical protein